MHHFDSLKDLTTTELLELLYYIEGIKVEKEEFVDFYENLLDIQKAIWVNTDPEERKIRDIIEKFLLVSEKESLTQLYKLSEKRLGEIKVSLEYIKIDIRYKKYGQYIFQTDIQTLPIKIKQLDFGDIDKISEVKLSDLEKQLNDIEFKIAEKGAVKARADLKLRHVPRITAVKGQIATRIRDFTDVVGTNLQSKLKAEIYAGIKAGEGTSEIAKRIRGVYKKPVPIDVKPLIRDGKQIRAGYSYSISNKKWSEMVARSESSWSVNQGRVEAYKSSGLVKNVVWQTAAHPCPDCGIMEGQILELYEAENMIPYHVHCKCTWTVNTYKSVDEKLPEPPAMFSDELYDKPDGVGITGIMKMSPGNQRVFNRALELGNYKQAEKIMRHQHVSASTLNKLQFKPGYAEQQWSSATSPNVSVLSGKVEIDTVFSSTERKFLEDVLDGLPKKVQNESILRTILYGSEVDFRRVMPGGFKTGYGMTASAQEGSIKVYGDVLKHKKFIKESLIHEWAHLKDATKRFSASDKYRAIVKKEGFITTYSYSQKLITEDFAETLMLYVNDPVFLKWRAKEHYKYIDDIFKTMKYLMVIDLKKVVNKLVVKKNYFDDKRELVDKEKATYMEYVYYTEDKLYVKSIVEFMEK